MFKFIFKSFFLYFLVTAISLSDDNFNSWLSKFKTKAIKSGISESVVNEIMSDAKFLPKVIEYDRYQPEFYEDTFTYIKKRSSNNKIKKGLKLYKKEKIIIENVEKDFDVEKELLLALMGIETNFGTYLGKMDIVSSLATLSFDKRRSKFFTNELLILLKLIQTKKIDYKTLYGSWAGAFGYFQFMPSTMNNYAIDYDNNNYVDLKSNMDAFASAANYLEKIGWKQKQPCFYKIILSKKIPKKYLNVSAKNIHDKKKLQYFRKYIKDNSSISKEFDNYLVAIITPDKDIIPDSENYAPAYVVFNNYEVILKWNRSLRFSLAVCTLKDKFKNDL
jgi:membrane-bound lytic murein transglycosylase B